MNDKKLLYVKEGRKYKPIAEYYTTDYMGFGHYLVHICKGSTSFKLILNPEYANVLAALHEHRDEACKVLMKGLEYQTKTPITDREKELWEELKKELKSVYFTIWQQSANDVIESFINFLTDKIKEKDDD